MPTTYTMADADVKNLVTRVIAARFPRLHDAQCRIGVLLAHNGDGPAIKHHGYAVLACIKPVALKDRLTKGYDAEMLIDAAEFRELRERQQEATIAHELSHIDTVPLSDKELKAARQDGSEVTWKTDDLGRPKLTSVPGDWASSDGFDEVVADYGDDAIEYVLLDKAKRRADRARDEERRQI